MFGNVAKKRESLKKKITIESLIADPDSALSDVESDLVKSLIGSERLRTLVGLTAMSDELKEKDVQLRARKEDVDRLGRMVIDLEKARDEGLARLAKMEAAQAKLVAAVGKSMYDCIDKGHAHYVVCCANQDIANMLEHYTYNVMVPAVSSVPTMLEEGVGYLCGQDDDDVVGYDSSVLAIVAEQTGEDVMSKLQKKIDTIEKARLGNGKFERMRHVVGRALPKVEANKDVPPSGPSSKSVSSGDNPPQEAQAIDVLNNKPQKFNWSDVCEEEEDECEEAQPIELPEQVTTVISQKQTIKFKESLIDAVREMQQIGPNKLEFRLNYPTRSPLTSYMSTVGRWVAKNKLRLSDAVIRVSSHCTSFTFAPIPQTMLEDVVFFHDMIGGMDIDGKQYLVTMGMMMICAESEVVFDGVSYKTLQIGGLNYIMPWWYIFEIPGKIKNTISDLNQFFTLKQTDLIGYQGIPILSWLQALGEHVTNLGKSDPKPKEKGVKKERKDREKEKEKEKEPEKTTTFVKEKEKEEVKEKEVEKTTTFVKEKPKFTPKAAPKPKDPTPKKKVLEITFCGLKRLLANEVEFEQLSKIVKYAEANDIKIVSSDVNKFNFIAQKNMTMLQNNSVKELVDHEILGRPTDVDQQVGAVACAFDSRYNVEMILACLS